MIDPARLVSSDAANAGARAWHEASMIKMRRNSPWEQVPAIQRFGLMESLLPALTAAAPHVAAEALRAAADQVEMHATVEGIDGVDDPRAVVTMLRKMADEIVQ